MSISQSQGQTQLLYIYIYIYREREREREREDNIIPRIQHFSFYFLFLLTIIGKSFKHTVTVIVIQSLNF